MQTYNPDHFIIQAARQQDFLEFFQNEVPFRKALMYPPFSRMVQLKISSNNALKAKTFAGNVAKVLKALLDNDKKQNNMLQILGPIEAPIQRISSKFRWQILVKSPSSKSINKMITSMMAHPEINPASGVRLIVDVDPYSLM